MSPFRILLRQIPLTPVIFPDACLFAFILPAKPAFFARILYILSLPHFSNSRLSYLLEAILQVYNHV